MTLRFKGKLRWHGKRGRLEVIYNEARRSWYAHITVKVENVVGARGSLRAGVDLARHGQRTGRRLRPLCDRRRRFLRHALNSMVRKIMEELKERGMGEVVVGYPRDTVRDHGNELTVNFWNYSYIIKRFKEIGEELGIGVSEVAEPNTSKSCSLCGESHESGRIRRGLYKCPRMGKAMNADLNGAVNILHIPESLGSRSRGQLPGRDRGNGLKASLVYRWTNGAGCDLHPPAVK
jgi:putative transposase